MPHLLKHSSLAHIIWGCSSQGEESQGVPSRASGTVSTSSLALLCAGGCSGPPCHDPFSSPSPPLPMLEKISFSRFLGLFFFLSPWWFYTSLCQCLCYRLCCVYSTAPTPPHHIHMLKPYLLMWLYLEIEPLRKCWDQRNLYAGQEATVRTGHGTDWFQIGKGEHQGCISSPCLFNFYAEYIMRNAGRSTSWNQDCREKYQ